MNHTTRTPSWLHSNRSAACQRPPNTNYRYLGTQAEIEKASIRQLYDPTAKPNNSFAAYPPRSVNRAHALVPLTNQVNDCTAYFTRCGVVVLLVQAVLLQPGPKVAG